MTDHGSVDFGLACPKRQPQPHDYADSPLEPRRGSHACQKSTRRAVLGAGALTGLGIALTGCTSDDKAADKAAAASSAPVTSDPSTPATPSAAEFDPKNWDSVRAQFPLDPDIAQFAAFVLASHPAPVANAIQTHRDGLDRDTEGYLLTKDFESEVRQSAGAHLDVPADEVALTDSATMGLGLLYTGMNSEG